MLSQSTIMKSSNGEDEEVVYLCKKVSVQLSFDSCISYSQCKKVEKNVNDIE